MNTTPTAEPSALVSKPARRPSRSREQWADLIAQHAASDLDVAAFCAQHDVGVAGFYAWRRRLASPDTAAGADPEPPRFVRLASTPAPDVSLTAHFPGGVRLTLPASSLPVLVATLRETAPC